MNFRDVELLSAYLDGQLTPSEVARLEARVVASQALRQVLDDLRVSRGLLRRVPRRKAPRNFTLRPTNLRVRAPEPRLVPLLRYASAVASLLFVFAFGFNVLSPIAARTIAAAPVGGYGMGGGGGGPETEELMQPFAAAPASGTAESAAPEPPADMATADASAKAAPAEPPAAEARERGVASVPSVWVLGLAVAALLLVALSIYLDRLTRRNFRSREMEK